ncbi:MAG: nucleotidyl transferase AbiEii/AbiGii toxin family protein [Candidatus Omnitrophota bacterium]|nr:nucleotidyl transferase AbiEii/AbiGii toxin family protein [Candidatus Omnitrophota bacterium]
MAYNQLQLREIFHLEFLRWLGRKIKAENYALKGGVNLRFFFNSFRYSEDMDLDASGIKVDTLKEIVMKILEARSFQEPLRPFGIEKITAPDMSKAKQTETTQRFKVHLLTAAGEDLFTKVEFSRRGFKGEMTVQPVSDAVLRSYKLPPLICPHYSAETAVLQKAEALASRSVVQARDVFDIYILIPQVIASPERAKQSKTFLSKSTLNKAKENALEISFEQFRDTVVSYLAPEDKAVYDKAAVWDDIKLKVTGFIDKIGQADA